MSDFQTKQEVTSSNLVSSSSTALRWGVARLAIGRNDAAVNKRTSERLWNTLGLKQFASAVVVHSGIKSLKWKLSLPRSLLYARLAQPGEHMPYKHGVGGSNPSSRTNP